MNVSRLQGIGMTSQRTRERLVRRLMEEGISNTAVLDAIRSTPRHIFVDEALESRSYDDTALPIGFGQTISQPYIVARMTELLIETGPCHKVLEIGTGSGYQAAILGLLVDEVYSVERISGLLVKARKRLRELQLHNVKVKAADGTMGWPEKAPYDAIILTAAPNDIPTELYQQLALDGRMIAPVGGAGAQDLVLITRTEQGFDKVVIEKVSFVPLLPGSQ
ncbi:MAG TPA: protein-L-isoaspartate(D-aspartate) O-methyltransferase [Candidatus Tenderia sp.]|nr:protein-L-isoaspartate(D-aspartate) O-methyltransferase [Candidatus Tenderia sp.]